VLFHPLICWTDGLSSHDTYSNCVKVSFAKLLITNLVSRGPYGMIYVLGLKRLGVVHELTRITDGQTESPLAIERSNDRRSVIIRRTV